MHPAPANERLAARYEALIRLAEVIRSHPEEGALFQTLASELHDVVELDGFCQFDGAGNRVQWHFDGPYKSGLEVRRLEPVPKEETLAWWVYQNQQPIIVRLGSPDNRFPRMRDSLAKLGLQSSCTLPLSTAHRQLGSISFVSHLEEAYSAEEQRFLSLVANQIALAMDDGRAQQRLRLLLDLTNRVALPESGHEQAGVTRSASGNFHEHSPDYALRLRRSGSPRSGNGRSAPVRHGFF